MNPSSPTQAILWRCWRLTWRQFLITQAVLFALTLPLLRMFYAEMATAELNEVVGIIKYIFVLFLWAATMPVTYRSELGIRAFGYMFGYDFVRPVSVVTLVLVPLVYLAALYILAYLIPSLVFQWLFDAPGAYWFICLTIAGLVIVVNIANWWSSDGWGCVLGLVVIVGLYGAGFLLPDMVTDEQTGVVSLVSNGEIIIPLVSYLVLLLITIAGVARQRHGENLLALENRRLFKGRYSIGGLLSLEFLKRPCPTGSAFRAEMWLEGRFRGLTNHALYGVLGALAALIMLVYVWAVDQDVSPQDLDASALVLLGTVALSVIYFIMAYGCYGVTMTKGAGQVVEFGRSSPLSTPALVCVKFGTALAGILVSAASLYLTFRILGPIFIDRFAELHAGFSSGLLSFFGNNLISGAARFLQLCLIILMGQVFFASVIAWCAIYSRLWWCFLAIPIYILVLSAILRAGGLEAEPAARVLIDHLWILVVAVPLATLYFLYSNVVNAVISLRQAALLIVVCGILYFLHISQSQALLDYDPQGGVLLSQMLFYLIGLLPLTACGLALFTMHHYRHR